jgi:hypothetical protein
MGEKSLTEDLVVDGRITLTTALPNLMPLLE